MCLWLGTQTRDFNMVAMHPVERWFVNSRIDSWFHRSFGIRRLIEHIEGPDPETIYEVGCGVGITTRLIAGRFPNASITAIDIDSGQIQRARKLSAHPNVEFREGDATQLETPGDSVDACFASFVLHHMPDYRRAVAEVARVLKTGAKLYVLDASVQSLNLFHRWVRFHHLGEFTRQELVDALEGSGLKVHWHTGRFLIFIECVKGR